MHSAIIGIGSGLGTSIAGVLARRGHRLSIVARSSDTLDAATSTLRQAGADVASYQGDAADADRMAAVFQQMSKRDGDVDTLVFNVAQIRPDRFVTAPAKPRLGYGEAWETSDRATTTDEFMASLRVNVGSALQCVKLVMAPMCERRRGAIMITGGTLGLTPWIEWASLSAGKAALRSLARSLFAELRPFDVHAALVTIHDTIAAGTPYDPGTIAEFYAAILDDVPEAWRPEYHFNPTGARAVDRDLLELPALPEGSSIPCLS